MNATDKNENTSSVMGCDGKLNNAYVHKWFLVKLMCCCFLLVSSFVVFLYSFRKLKEHCTVCVRTVEYTHYTWVHGAQNPSYLFLFFFVVQSCSNEWSIWWICWFWWVRWAHVHTRIWNSILMCFWTENLIRNENPFHFIATPLPTKHGQKKKIKKKSNEMKDSTTEPVSSAFFLTFDLFFSRLWTSD